MIGWLKSHRKILKSWMWRRKNKNAFLVFFFLLHSVEFERVEKPERGYTLEAGETDLTLSQIAKGCFLTVKQARSALEILTKKGALKRAQLRAHKRAQDGTRTTLVNWASYQSGEKVGTQKGTEGGTEQGNSLRREEVKNKKESTRERARGIAPHSAPEKTETEHATFTPQNLDGLESFWGAYPESAREARGAVEKAWREMPDEDRGQALSAIPEYAALCEQANESQRRFIPSPSNWLKERRYADSRDAWKTRLKIKVASESTHEAAKAWGRLSEHQRQEYLENHLQHPATSETARALIRGDPEQVERYASLIEKLTTQPA
jgi:hypothetical protein